MQRNHRATESGLRRRAEFVRDGIDKANRRVTLALSSETPVDRGSYMEVLDHGTGSVDLSRLQNAHPLLLNHNPDTQIGVVEKAWLGVDRVLRCVVRFGTGKLASEAFDDVLNGIRKHVSVGYEHIKELSASKDRKPVVRFAWRPYEASIVAIPADPSVGVGRTHPVNARLEPQLTTRGISTAEFNREIEQIKRQQKHMRTTNQQPAAKTKLFGLNSIEAQEFSIVRAVRDIVQTGQVQGFEAEMLEEGRRQFPGQIQGNIFIPPDLVVGCNRRDPLFRDLNVTTATQGGNFVQTTVMTPIIEILRNKMVVQKAGCQVLAGLVGNIAIPRQTGAATAYTLAEQATLTKSTQSLAQVSMTPRRAGATVPYSKQLFLQSSVDVENFLRNDLMAVLAIKIDYLALQGGGGADPIGIKNVTGISAVTFGGAATWAKAIEYETDLALANADVGRISYITSPDVRGRWKQIPKVVASTFPIFLWEDPSLRFPDADGIINGYQAFSTNQITGSQMAYGNFEDAILGFWGGFDLIIDPFTQAPSATINVTINAFFDFAARHAASFAWSSDSAAQ